MVKIDKKWWKSTKNGATSILDGATSGDGLGAVLISRSEPKILRKIQKNLRWYITTITRFLHVCFLPKTPKVIFEDNSDDANNKVEADDGG